MALLQPVAPNTAPPGYQATGQLGPAPTGPVMPTREQMQANLMARTGTTGPQYGGAGLGAMNPGIADPGRASENTVAKMYQDILNQHNQALSQAQQTQAQNLAQQQTPEQLAALKWANGAPGRASEAAAAQNYQNIHNDMAASRGLAQQSAQESANRQRISNDPAIAAQMNKIQSMPDGMQKYAMLNNYQNQLAQKYPGSFLPTGKTNQQVAKAQSDQGAGVRRAEYMDARRLAEEKYYRDRSEKMRQAQAGPGFSLGNLAQAFNPFKGVTRMVEGQGRPQDYLKLASFFL